MATKFYFHAANSSVAGTLPSTEQSSLTIGQSFDAQTVNRSMSTTIGTTQATLSRTPVIGATNYYVTKFISPKIYQTSIAANTWTYGFTASETATTQNFPVSGNNQSVRVNCYVWRPSDGTKVGTILDGTTASTVDEGSANSQTYHIVTFSGSQVTGVQDGDVIVFEVWFIVNSTVSTGTITFYYDGTTEGTENGTTTSAASNISTPEDINFLQRVTSDFITKYDISGRVTSDIIAKYDILGRVTSDFISKYNILERVESDFISKYTIYERVTSDLIAKYNITERIISDFISKYDIYQRIHSDFITKYNILERVVADFIAKYDILSSLTRVTSDLIVKYDITGRVTSDLTTKYDILSRVISDFIVKYNILGRVHSDFTTVYDILTDILTRVESDLTIKYNIVERVHSDLTTKYHIFGGLNRRLDDAFTAFPTLTKKIKGITKWRN